MEDFVPYELAVKLNEKGFNEDCYTVYNTATMRIERSLTTWKGYKGVILAPTISQVLKWLRDRNIHIEPFLVNAETVQYKLNIMGWNGKFFSSIYNSLLEDANNKTITTYQSYEQAALAGIEYVIENNI